MLQITHVQIIMYIAYYQTRTFLANCKKSLQVGYFGALPPKYHKPPLDLSSPLFIFALVIGYCEASTIMLCHVLTLHFYPKLQ